MSERKRVNIKTILADPILREEIMEGATDFICKVEGIRPHSLSPAAQAVLDAATNVKHPEIEAVAFQCTRLEVAAALQASAEHLKTIGPWAGHLESSALNWAILEIESIAAELEAQS